MKNLFKILTVASLGLVMVACGSADPYYGNRYPNGSYPTNNGTVYRAPDGTVYGRNDVYRDRNGNVYQNGRVVRTGDVYGRPGILQRGGNYPVYGQNQRNLPPGQAKKVYGGSAKDYAPGQVKKRNGYYNNDRRWNDDDRWEDGNSQGNKQYKKYKNKGKGKHK